MFFVKCLNQLKKTESWKFPKIANYYYTLEATQKEKKKKTKKNNKKIKVFTIVDLTEN
jgi:hypothetical protein